MWISASREVRNGAAVLHFSCWNAIINDDKIGVLALEETEDVEAMLACCDKFRVVLTCQLVQLPLFLGNERGSIEKPSILKNSSVTDPAEIRQLSACKVIVFLSGALCQLRWVASTSKGFLARFFIQLSEANYVRFHRDLTRS